MSVMAKVSRDLHELAWCRFLSSLRAAELHWLCHGDRELLLHDAYLAGLCNIEEVHSSIREAVDAYTPASTRVD